MIIKILGGQHNLKKFHKDIIKTGSYIKFSKLFKK